ncbi:PREDICTED: uncharacterized protein LOC106791428 [Polistes canadensis]|uniref:uncharacterized protein LOC106791428 n=1 Tax=Polistes canadensis TaxID=91411 RepID=UPI000718EB2B|nr:PREDICTED: uncharacterized protein LOC106791428 [Polistes canadensis]KAI4476386.1 hypothetical protein M0804_013657 [Polistes exclamans]
MVTIGTEAKLKSWTPSQSCKIQDKIISSDYTTKKTFIPSYEKERRPCIELLLSNEYQRIWWRDKKSWEKAVVPQTSKKKLLQRMIIKKIPKKDSCPPKFPVFETKKKKKPKNSENLDLAKKSSAV